MLNHIVSQGCNKPLRIKKKRRKSVRHTTDKFEILIYGEVLLYEEV